MNRRPAGVILSAIVLALAALIALLFTVTTALSAFLIKNTSGLSASTPGTTPPPNAFIFIAMAGVCLFYFATAIWAIVTLVGLLRMKRWSRISVIIIGACLTFLGACSVLGAFAAQALAKTAPSAPKANPVAMHVAFLVMGSVSLLIAAIGVWWLIYFNLSRTKAAFTQSVVVVLPDAPLYPIDFTYAQQHVPVPTDAVPLTTASYVAPTLRRANPLSTQIIGWLMIVTAVICLLEAWLPIPLFFLGIALSGWSSHIFMLIIVVVSAYGGYGLLRLQRPAWLLTVAWYFVGVINVTLLFWPHYRTRMLQYSLAFSQSMNTRIGMPAAATATAFNSSFMDAILIFGAVFSEIVFVVFFVLLWRARWAFAPKNSLD
jgi:hypothetical protein